MWAIVPAAAASTVAAAALVGCAKSRPEPQRRPQQRHGSQRGARAHHPHSKSGRSHSSKSVSSSKRAQHSGKGVKKPGQPSQRSKTAVPAGAPKPKGPSSKGHSSSRSARAKPAGAQSQLREQKTQSVTDSSRKINKSKKQQHSSSSGRSKVVAVAGKKGSRKSQRSTRSQRSSRSKKSARSVKVACVNPAPQPELRMSPSELYWKQAGGLQHVSVTNTSDTKRAIKIKCSDNLLYRANPVHAFVEPGESTRIDILRLNGAAKLDKIVVVSAQADRTDTCAKSRLAQSGQTEQLLLPLIVQAE